MSDQIPDIFTPSGRDYIANLNAMNRQLQRVSRNSLPGILKSHLFVMEAGQANYTLPHPAIVGIHMAFLNGVKTTVSITGNVVTATQFAAAQYTAKDELEVFFFI